MQDCSRPAVESILDASRSWGILQELNAGASMVQALLVVGQVALISLVLIPAKHRASLYLSLITMLLCRAP